MIREEIKEKKEAEKAHKGGQDRGLARPEKDIGIETYVQLLLENGFTEEGEEERREQRGREGEEKRRRRGGGKREKAWGGK